MESAATGGVVTSCPSILDKPLNQLTEDDISQLTREDCRKYLKEKGMRRPSWNKSQAIQQVISLKALLETATDSGAGVLRRILVSKPVPQGTVKEAIKGIDGVSTDDAVPCGRNDYSKADCPPAFEMHDANTADLGSSGGWRNASLEQMTIFYSGKVNVYDGVPPDKARTIMHLAVSPKQLSLADHVTSSTFFSQPTHLCCPSDKADALPFSCMAASTLQTENCVDQPKRRSDKGNPSVDHDVESPACRKVSLQRYLEKKRERGRCKSKRPFGFTSSGLDLYWNPCTTSEIISGQSIRSTTNLQTQSRDTAFSVDLNSGPS